MNKPMSRRTALRKVAAAAATTAVVAKLSPTLLAQSQVRASAAATAQVVPATFKLPPLPYAYDALEPHIDARTMEIHHDRHHRGYVNNLNKAVADYPSMAKETVEVLLMNVNSAVPEVVRTAVRNNGGGHANHSLFWQTMKKDGGGEPKGELAKAIAENFGSFSEFKAEFSAAAASVFGSGWVWLALDASTLKIITMPNQDSPLMVVAAKATEHLRERYGLREESMRRPTLIPIMGIDVWEHAYYLKYQNKRASYVAAWFNVIDWDFASARFLDAAREWGQQP